MKLFTLRDAKRLLPKRSRFDNKTRGGKTLIVAGSSGMEGAAIMCATAAARSGAGYVYLSSSSKSFLNLKHPDFLILKSQKQFDEIQFSSVAIGPGFKKPLLLNSWLNKLSKINFPNVVLDAEAINFLSQTKLKIKLPATWILTPHEGELARLLKISSSEIKKNRTYYAQLAQKKLGCIILLKGHGTLICGDRKSVQIPTGNPSLAKAGTGDVLTGMIAAFLSQGLSPFEAASLAAFIHGQLADRWIKEGHDVLSLMASDLIAKLPIQLAKLRN